MSVNNENDKKNNEFRNNKQSDNTDSNEAKRFNKQISNRKSVDENKNKVAKEKIKDNNESQTTEPKKTEVEKKQAGPENTNSHSNLDDDKEDEDKKKVKKEEQNTKKVFMEYLSSIIILQNLDYLSTIKENISKPNLVYLNQLKMVCLLDDRIEIDSHNLSQEEYIKLSLRENIYTLIRDFNSSIARILSDNQISLTTTKQEIIFNHIIDFLIDSNVSKEDIFLQIVNSPPTKEYADFFNLLFDFLCDNVNSIFPQEKELNGKLYQIKENRDKDWIVISDLHGDREAFVKILQKEDIFTKTDKNIVFLGDFIDRGSYQPWVLLGVMMLKYFYPNRIYLLRGNHEYLRRNKNNVLEHTVSDSGDPDSLFVNFWHNKIKIINSKVLEKINDFFENLPGLIKLDKILIVHGGIPKNDGEYKDFEFNEINSLSDLHNEKLLYQMHWSDPSNGPYKIQFETRFQFGVEQFDRFMDIINCDIMIRGHEKVSDGYQLLSDYNNRLITLFSTGNNPNSNDDNCYIGYADVKPCYGTIKDKQKILIKRVFEDEGIQEIKFSEIARSNINSNNKSSEKNTNEHQ